MARTAKTTPVDLTTAQELTAGRIERLTCPLGKPQAFLRDTKAPALRVRVTPSGFKAFIFEAKLRGKSIRLTIGDVRAWSIEQARTEANRLRVIVDGETDPRELRRQQAEAAAARKAAETVHAVTVRQAWDVYVEERRHLWSEHYYLDHIRKAKPGGVPVQRGSRGRGVTIDGPLYPLMQLKLEELTAGVIQSWAVREGKSRATSARLAWRLLKTFLTWCSEQDVYASILPAQNPAQTRRAREALGKPRAKRDVLQREQLPHWFKAVRETCPATTAAYLQGLLLTGARPGELLQLRWADVDTKWRSIVIRDKVEDDRVIPLTPYMAALLAGLPRVNDWAFASPLAALDPRYTVMSKPHEWLSKACGVAEIEGLTLHGLRRSFRTLSEWLELPAGVVAQIMGHKPSAIAEKHYTVRPLDMLRMYHERVEAWILKQAGVDFAGGSESRPRRKPGTAHLLHGRSFLRRRSPASPRVQRDRPA
jgi:integrase